MPNEKGHNQVPDYGKNAIVILSGGAPLSPLAAGALYAIYNCGKTFSTFYTSGAGAVVAMLYVGPKDLSTPAAMKSVIDSSIDDKIWDWFPVPYKTFFKSGPFTVPFELWAKAWQLPKSDAKLPHRRPHFLRYSESFRRFYNDSLYFWAAAACPTDLTFFSEGLCAPFPFVKELIDFEKVRKFTGDFLANAYSIEDGVMEEFSKDEMSEEYFDAALAFPFVYPPAPIRSKHYFEGSSLDPLNLGPLVRYILADRARDYFVVLIDVLGSFRKGLIRRPTNLIDAFGISIMTPIVSLAEKTLHIYQEHPPLPLVRLTFDIPDNVLPHLSDWSYRNMNDLWCIGVTAGKQFVQTYGNRLPDHAENSPNPVYTA